MTTESENFISLALLWVALCRIVQATSPFLSSVFWGLTGVAVACRLLALSFKLCPPAHEISLRSDHLKTV